MSGRRRGAFRSVVALAVMVSAVVPCACETPSGLDSVQVSLSASQDVVVFDDTVLGAEASRTVGLTNTSSVPGTIEATVLAGASEFALGAPASPINVGPGERVDVQLQFRPLSPGGFEGAITFAPRPSVGEAPAPPLTVTLVGRGVQPLACDDGNPCTDDAFEPASQTCVHLVHQRACATDGCTEDGQCVDGRCVGTPRTCPVPVSPCRQGMCDPDEGCVEIEVAGACDDDDPCTEDLCTDTGCAHVPLDDLAPCGPLVQCQSASVCMAGVCTEVPLPDGSPCSDGLLCTTDVCEGGLCVGTPVSGEPEVTFSRLTVGGAASSSHVRPDGSVLIYDPLQPELHAGREAGPGTLSVLRNDGSGWHVASSVRTTFDAASLYALGRASDWFLLSINDGLSDAASFGRLSEDGALFAHPLPQAVLGPAILDDVLYGCSDRTELAAAIQVFTLHDDGATNQPPVSLPARCRGVHLIDSDDGPRLAVVSAPPGGAVELSLYDLHDPLAPVHLATTSVTVESAFDELRLGGDERFVVINGVGQAGGVVEVIDLASAADAASIVSNSLTLQAPTGFSSSGVAAVVDGAVVMRWAESNAAPGRLFARVIGESTWTELPAASVRDRIHPPVQRSADLWVVPGDARSGSLLFIGDEFTALVRAELPHHRGGALVQHGGRFLNVSSEGFSWVGPPNEEPTFELIAPRAEPTSASVVKTATQTVWVDPLQLGLASFGAVPLEIDETSARGATLNAANELSTSTIVLPLPSNAGANADPPGGQVARGIMTDTGTLVTLGRSEGDLVLFTRAPGVPYPGQGTWAPTGSMVLEENAPNDLLSAMASAGSQVAVSYWSALSTRVALVDVADPLMPELLASVSSYVAPLWTNSMALSGDTLVAVSGTEATVLRHLNGNLILVETWSDLTPASKVIRFDGETLVLSTPLGLEYRSLANGGALLHALDLGDRALDIAEQQNQLYVTTETGLHVVSPPCPGP